MKLQCRMMMRHIFVALLLSGALAFQHPRALTMSAARPSRGAARARAARLVLPSTVSTPPRAAAGDADGDAGTAAGERRALDRQFVAIALPALAQFAAEPLAGLVDTAYMGRLGAAALGGAGDAADGGASSESFAAGFAAGPAGSREAPTPRRAREAVPVVGGDRSGRRAEAESSTTVLEPSRESSDEDTASAPPALSPAGPAPAARVRFRGEWTAARVRATSCSPMFHACSSASCCSCSPTMRAGSEAVR